MRNHRVVLSMCLLLVGAGASACKPNLGSPVSLINGPTILAVRGEPAEAAPQTQVSYEVLAVDVDGRIPAPAPSEVTLPALWAICTTPKPPIETNAVSRACLDGVALPGQLGDSLTTYSAPMPDDACQLFGPITPTPKPNEPAIRPRDPDVTGGYYLPVRVSLWIPEDRRRSGMAGSDTLVSFGLERISCGLANVDSERAREFNQTYTLNRNPRLAGVTMTAGRGEPVTLTPGKTAHVGHGETIALEASWAEGSAETYPVDDSQSAKLVPHREAMVVSWYATGGSFEHDSTGRSDTETELTTANHWTAGEPGPVNLWTVLRDDRGGTDFVGYLIEVDP
jgi:hypothetical protein